MKRLLGSWVVMAAVGVGGQTAAKELAPGVIAGTVHGSDGEPGIGLVVEARASGGGASGANGSMARVAVADDEGNYRLYGLAPGRYVVDVVAGRDFTGGAGIVEFYPGTTVAEKAGAVEVRAGGVVRGVDLTVPRVVATTGGGDAVHGGSVRGFVMRWDTNEPVGNALVELDGSSGDRELVFSTRSDRAGQYGFEGLPAGAYELRVRHVAFLEGAATSRYGGDERSVRVSEGERSEQKAFLLMPRGVVAGRVMVDGRAAVNAMVTVERVAGAGSERKLVPFGNAYANDLGEYRFFNVSPGRYYVSAVYHAAGGENAKLGVAPVFYPGAGALSEAVPVEVRAGSQQLSVNLMLSHTRSWTVRGRVSAERGVMGDVQVELAALDPVLATKLGGQNVVAMRDGSFEIPNVLPGEYVLRAAARGTDGVVTGRAIVHVARGDVSGAAVRLAPAMRVLGRVETEGDGKCRYGELHVMLQAAGDVNVAPLLAAVMESGEFTLENVAPERYRLSVVGTQGGCYLKAVAVGGKNADDDVVTLLQAGQELHVLMSSRGAEISGVVLDENQQAVRAAIVLLIADGGSERRELSCRVAGDAAGTFVMEGIAPGKYVLFALSEGAEEANEDEAAPVGRGVGVSVAEGERKQLQLRMQSVADR